MASAIPLISGTALAAGVAPKRHNKYATTNTPQQPNRIMPNTYFITWTTYGTWLPGDGRGWRKSLEGEQLPQPLLEDWSKEQMSGTQVLLNETHQHDVETVCRDHASIRGWQIHAINVRTNHVHIVLSADCSPDKVRNQLKANATRVLRNGDDPMDAPKIWTRGADVKFVNGKESLEKVVFYVTEAQDRMERGK